ncbi:riboflavin kinase-FAD synthetase [Candidatus Malacoplasma girerdii]|uniref:Riboflavin kinase-FAD synthetase n=1 Tax=Candidatus Malacoplasma girerdii TaxID=1318617 RepID=A0A097SS39_9BACT|nr:riboflavin kinase-FAD synthetase [Candidatus Malacoplasma girerdii]ASJ88935.1 MAG: riboflavin kinase/FAD synthase (bifunctional) [Candidatus Malacoplasma girerdii]
MKAINLTKTTKIKKQLPLVIGFFDVIHLGHKLLFKDLANKKFNVLLITNSPNKQVNINSLQNRINNLSILQPQNVFIYDVLKNKNITDKQFVKLIKQTINPNQIIVGNNFKYGKNAKGNISLLKKYFNVQNIKLNSEYKTSKIKHWIQTGKYSLIHASLVFPIIYEFVVIKGKQLSRQWGYPTLNSKLNLNKQINLKPGTYATLTGINNQYYLSATYVADIDKKSKTQVMETHVLDTNLSFNHYGKKINLFFIEYLKKNTFCKSHFDLQKALTSNINLVKRYFKNPKRSWLFHKLCQDSY